MTSRRHRRSGTQLCNMNGPRRAHWERLAAALGLDDTTTDEQIVSAVETLAATSNTVNDSAGHTNQVELCAWPT